MAAGTDVKSLLLEIDASVELLKRNLTRGESDVAKFERNVQQQLDAGDRRFSQFGRGLNLSGPIAKARTDIAGIGTTIARTEQQVRASSGAMKTALLSSTAAIGAALSVNQVANYADGYTRFTNQLKVAGQEGGALTKTQNDLYAIAQKYGVELEAIGTLYGRNAASAKELGLGQTQQLRIAEATAAALKVTGQSTGEASGALLQFSQLLGGTNVQAQEYNSLIDGARPLLQAVAAGSDRWGGSVAKLTKDVKAGAVTTKEFVDALLRGSGGVIDQAAKSNLTIGASFVILNNALGKYIGEADAAGGATGQVSQAIVALANNLDVIVPALTLIGLGFATNRVASSRFVAEFVSGTGTAGASARVFAQQITLGNVAMIDSAAAVAARAEVVAAGARTEVASIEATIAARRADQASLAQSLTLIEAQRAAALQAQAAIAANAAIGLGTVGVTRSIPDAARANQDLKAQIVTKRALAAVDAELAAAETALAGAQQRAAVATTAASVAATEATVAARAGAAASKVFAGALTLIGGSVAGGAAVLAIGALVAAVLYFRSQAKEGAAQLVAFAQHEREAAETSKLLASYALSAGTHVAGVGSSAVTATPGVLAFAGAVGELAGKLRAVAEARRDELRARAASDRANASTDALAARQRFQAASGTYDAKVGYIGRDDEARAAAVKQYNSAAQRFNNANGILQQSAKVPLTAYIRETDRPGGRDTAGDLTRVRRDLTIAQQSGNKAQIADLKAQQFELTQYAKYRKDGLSVEASNAQASKDSADFRNASGEKEARVSGARSAREAATAKRQEAVAVRDAAADARAYSAAERGANNDIATAQAELANSAEDRAKIEKARIESERVSRNDELADQLKQGRFGDGATGKARLLELQRLNDVRAGLEGQVVDQRERQRVASDELAVAQAGRGNQRDLLQSQSALADTASERRRLELAILDIQYDEEAARLRAVTVANGATDAEAKIAAQRLALLPELKSGDQKGVVQKNAGSVDQYRDRLKTATGDIHTALEDVTADGLQNLEDGLLGIVTGTESVGSAFKKMAKSIISDLARIAIQKAILSAIGMGGGFGGLFGFAGGGSLSDIPGRADGGSLGGQISGPGTGTSDSILALLKGPGGGAVRLSNKEFIMNESAVNYYGPATMAALNGKRLPKFATGGSLTGRSVPSLRAPTLPNLSGVSAGRRDRMIIETRSKVEASPLLLATVQETTIRTVSAASEPIMAGAEARTVRGLNRPSLPGGWG